MPHKDLLQMHDCAISVATNCNPEQLQVMCMKLIYWLHRYQTYIQILQYSIV